VPRHVVRQHQDRCPAVLDEIARYAVQEIRPHSVEVVQIFLDRIDRRVGPALQELGDPIILAVPVHDGRVFRPVTDGLAEYRGDDTLRRAFEELPGKAAADAIAHVEELANAEVVHQPQLVVGEGVPRILDRDRAARLAAIGIALVHRDAMEVVLELFHCVDHCGRPIADSRIEAAAGGDQQREAGSDLLVADTDVALLVKRHGVSPLREMTLVDCSRNRGGSLLAS